MSTSALVQPSRPYVVVGRTGKAQCQKPKAEREKRRGFEEDHEPVVNWSHVLGSCCYFQGRACGRDKV